MADGTASKTEMDEIFGQQIEELMKQPDSKERATAVAECEELKKIGNTLVESLASHGKIPEPKVPEGYRLPTFGEYEKLSTWDTERERLSGLVKVFSGIQKKEYIHARKEITANIIDYAEKNNIYFVRGSNRFIKEKSSL